ncbi:MAG: hypothetical protein ACYC8T_14985 [Myxococcaceae bacterium]
MADKNQLLSDALHLSAAERAEVARELLLSLPQRKRSRARARRLGRRPGSH